jgi:hypothetical protein
MEVAELLARAEAVSWHFRSLGVMLLVITH